MGCPSLHNRALWRGQRRRTLGCIEFLEYDTTQAMYIEFAHFSVPS